jgi:hypothetical protein
VERAEECEAVLQQRPLTPKAPIDPKLTEIPYSRRLTVHERVAHGPGRDRRNLSRESIAGEEGLVHVAFDRSGNRRVGLAFERQADCAGKRMLAQEPADRAVVAARRQLKDESVVALDYCARSNGPCHDSSPSGKPSRRFVSTRSMALIGKKFLNMNAFDRFTSSTLRRAMLGQL